jgi:hypothetical protein
VPSSERERLQKRLDPAEFATGWAQGRPMTADEATALALDELSRIIEAEPPATVGTRTPD